jgi:hypothetical protein
MALSESDIAYYVNFVGASTLHQQCDRAVLSLIKVNRERELDEWARVLSYATPDMPAFEIILNKVEDLVDSIDKANAILKLI